MSNTSCCTSNNNDGRPTPPAADHAGEEEREEGRDVEGEGGTEEEGIAEASETDGDVDELDLSSLLGWCAVVPGEL